MKDILIVLALQILVACVIFFSVESCISDHTINEDGSLNPIEVDSQVLFEDQRWSIKTIQYCGHNYIMTKHAMTHDPDCPCHEIYHNVEGGTEYD